MVCPIWCVLYIKGWPDPYSYNYTYYMVRYTRRIFQPPPAVSEFRISVYTYLYGVYTPIYGIILYTRRISVLK